MLSAYSHVSVSGSNLDLVNSFPRFHYCSQKNEGMYLHIYKHNLLRNPWPFRIPYFLSASNKRHYQVISIRYLEFPGLESRRRLTLILVIDQLNAQILVL